MFGTIRRQAANVQVDNVNVAGTPTPHQRTLTSWFPNLFFTNKKEKKNTPQEDVVNAKASDLQATPTVHSNVEKCKTPKKPKGEYVISKPSLVKRNDSEENVRAVLVDELNSSPANTEDAVRATHITQETEPSAAPTHEAPVPFSPVVCNPNRRNHRLPAIFGEYRPGYRTTILTVAPGADLVEWDQDCVALVNGASTRISTAESNDLTRAAYKDFIPRLSVDSFASGISSAYEPPASPIIAMTVEEGRLLSSEALLALASISHAQDAEQQLGATQRYSREASHPPSSPTTAEQHAVFDDLVRRADEEYERRMGGELYPGSVSDDEVANQAVTGPASIEDNDLTWDELKEIADREYEEGLRHSLPSSDAPAVRLSTMASVSAASADGRASAAEELPEVDWEEWHHGRDGDEEHRGRGGHAFDRAAPSETHTKKRSSQARRAIPRAARRVVRFFKTGKKFVRFLSGGPMVTLPTILK
ncbi:hypothetical protein FRB96_000844 [Tulasnella sp. 330]|nr:hypothetical protein FRB96_000844 [Tulasnella sp. 330]